MKDEIIVLSKTSFHQIMSQDKSKFRAIFGTFLQNVDNCIDLFELDIPSCVIQELAQIEAIVVRTIRLSMVTRCEDCHFMACC